MGMLEGELVGHFVYAPRAPVPEAVMRGDRKADEVRATIPAMADGSPTRVTLTEPELAGDYVVAERHPDGTLVLRPDGSAQAETAERARELADEHRETLDYLAEH